MPDMRFGMVTTFCPPRRFGGDAVHVPSRARGGRRPRYLAFPFGRHDASSREVATTRSRAAFGTRLAAMRDGDDRYALPRPDAYYRRFEAIRDRVDRGPARAWIAAHAALRRLRGRE